MNITEENHYATIPKREYEEMLKVVNEKKGVNVRYCLIYEKRSKVFGIEYQEVLYANELVFELNDKINYDDIVDTRKLIVAACEEIRREKHIEILELKGELEFIKSKWWCKLFYW